MIYKGARQVITSGAKLGTSQRFADASARKAQDVRRTRDTALTAEATAVRARDTLDSANVRGDDGSPPSAPVVRAVPFFHQVDLDWPNPPAHEEVTGSRVRVTPHREASRIVRRPDHAAVIAKLDHKPHTFEVLLYDRYGRESLWSDPVTATPMLTAAEEIDLTEVAMAGRLRGLLPDQNLATIQDATKLGAELVRSGAIAPGAVTGPKLPAGVIDGPKLAASAVEADKIAANAVTAPKILSDQIVSRHVAAGAVTSAAMATQDLAAVNAWMQNAAIRSAAIESLTADKITAGHLTAGTITLAGQGTIRAGGAVMDSTGFQMALHSGSGNRGSLVTRDLTIHSSDERRKMWFWESDGYRGMSLRAEAAGIKPSSILIGAYPDDSATTEDRGTGGIEMYSALDRLGDRGLIQINGVTEVVDHLYTVRTVEPTQAFLEGTVAPNGGWQQWGNRHFNQKLWPHFQADIGGGDWRPIEFLNDVSIAFVGPNNIRVENFRSGAVAVRGWAFHTHQT